MRDIIHVQPCATYFKQKIETVKDDVIIITWITFERTPLSVLPEEEIWEQEWLDCWKAFDERVGEQNRIKISPTSSGKKGSRSVAFGQQKKPEGYRNEQTSGGQKVIYSTQFLKFDPHGRTSEFIANQFLFLIYLVNSPVNFNIGVTNSDFLL